MKERLTIIFWSFSKTTFHLNTNSMARLTLDLRQNIVSAVAFYFVIISSYGRELLPCDLSGDKFCTQTSRCPDTHEVTSLYTCATGQICCSKLNLHSSTNVINNTTQPWIHPCGNSTYDDAGDFVVSTIVGGQEARPGEFPWQVSLLDGGSHACGAILINEQWILTAAHCVSDQNTQYSVIIGEHRRFETSPVEQEIPVNASSVHVHHSYNPFTEEHDIALLRIDPIASFTPFISPICGPNVTMDYDGMQCVVSGWGTTGEGQLKSNALQYTRVTVIGTAACQQDYIDVRPIHECNICAGAPIVGGRDACKGDSGGPLACKIDGIFHLIGIVSTGEGCGNADFPGVYTEVSCYMDWIESVMQSV